MRILIVDDQPSLGVVMVALVSQAGHTANLATNGYAAVKSAADLRPDVVLLDINMPGIDGFETARWLRERHGNQFRIFAVTGEPANIFATHQSDFDGIFFKPFSATKLNALLSKLS
jgi:DNA-binding response OmpR family regulator